MSYDGQFYFAANASGTPVSYLRFGATYTISFTVDTTAYPNLTYLNHWFVLSTNDGTGYVNICGNGSYENQTTWRYNGGNSDYNTNTNVMSVTFTLPSKNVAVYETYGQPFTLQNGNFILKAYCGSNSNTQVNAEVIQMKSNPVALIDFDITDLPKMTDIQPNKIIGTFLPNENVVVTETVNNQTTSSQIQSNAQGIWNFNVTKPSNQFSFEPLNVSILANTLNSNYSMRYPKNKYTLSPNTPILIKPRQHGTNELDQRRWRISPALPSGLKFSSVSGIISGRPTMTSAPTTYNIWSNSEVFLGYRRQLTIEIV
jgi:hypothetical protein